MVRQELKINTDLLIVEAGYRLMPNALLCMRDMLHRSFHRIPLIIRQHYYRHHSLILPFSYTLL